MFGFKKRTFGRRLKSKLRWSRWVPFIDGWIPKFALFVPIIGYLLLFNDQVSSLLNFNQLANTNEIITGLSGTQRLRFLYFGLISLGVSNFIYHLTKPFVFKFGTNIVDYTRVCLETFHFGNFLDMHGTISVEGHTTIDGKYYDNEWDGFVAAATDLDESPNQLKRTANWEAARLEYGSLLRSILSDNFTRYNLKNRGWLCLCLLLSSIGYICMLVPSLDIFIKVMVATITS